MREPRVAFHLVLELTRAPTGVTGEEAELLGGGKAAAQFDQFIERVAEAEVWQDVGVREKPIGVEEAHRRGLHRATDVGATLRVAVEFDPASTTARQMLDQIPATASAIGLERLSAMGRL